jgi:hypothetical protein
MESLSAAIVVRFLEQRVTIHIHTLLKCVLLFSQTPLALLISVIRPWYEAIYQV